MNYDYLWLALATLGLWIPAVTFSSANVRMKLHQATRRHRDGLQSLVRTPLNWVDAIRAAGCAWVVQWILSDVPPGQNDLSLVFLIVKLAILGLAVAFQCVLIGRQLCIVGPVFFLVGLTLVVAGPLVGVFAVVLGVVCSLMFQRLSLLFLFTPAFLLLFAKIFGKLQLPVIFNAGIFAAPLFMGFAFNRRLSFVRQPAGQGSGASSEAVHESNHEKLATVTPMFGPEDQERLAAQKADSLNGPAIA